MSPSAVTRLVISARLIRRGLLARFAWRSASARARAYAGHSDGGSGSGSTSTYGYRFAKGGHDVILGSRSEERAVDAAAVLDERVSGGRLGSRCDQCGRRRGG